jgi:hypothetical protein
MIFVHEFEKYHVFFFQCSRSHNFPVILLVRNNRTQLNIFIVLQT